MPIVEIPPAQFDAGKAGRGMLISNNRCAERVLICFTESYDDWWQLASRSKEDTQAALDYLTPQIYLPILNNAKEWIEEIKLDMGSSWDAGRYDKYLSSPYHYTINPETMRMVLGDLKPEWGGPPPEENPE